MGKDKQLEDEVRAAVQEYLGRLVDDGKPLTHSQLLTAAKSAGYNNAVTSNPPDLNVQQPTNGEIFRSQMNDKPKAKPKYHWMVWRTSPTPTPDHNTFHPNSRPKSESVTAPSIVTRPLARDTNPCRTPARATPSLAPESSSVRPLYSPALYNSVGVQACPEHIPPPSRTYMQTPDGFQPDHGDMPFAHTMAYQEDQDRCSPDQNQFLPKLRSWISKASVHERKAAINMMTSMDDFRPASQATCRPRARTALPGKYNPPSTQMYQRLPTAGIKTSQNHLFSKTCKDSDSEYSNNDDEGRKEQKQKRSMSSEPKRSSYDNPRFRRTVRKSCPSQMEYAHENSFFTNAQRPYRGHFIIHPEWVSEIKMLRNERRQQAKPIQQTNKYTYD